MKFASSGVAQLSDRLGERFDGRIVQWHSTEPSIAKFREIFILTTAVFLN